MFDEYPVDQAEGVILAHTTRFGEFFFKKGRLLTSEDILRMQMVGICSVLGARLDSSDIGEDKAAGEVAKTIAGGFLELGRPHTGRCNLLATADGLVVIEREIVDSINLFSSAITVGTLQPWSVVRRGDVVATVKIIPFAIPDRILELCKEHSSRSSINVLPFQPRRVALIMSESHGTPQSLLTNTIEVTRQRIEKLGSKLTLCLRCNHDAVKLKNAISEAYIYGCDLILISGASVTKDVCDIVPSAIIAAGGDVEHFGMPVEPGNMLLLAYLENIPVINIPGCARSPRLNGFDLILRRLLVNIRVSAKDIMLMGVGGLI